MKLWIVEADAVWFKDPAPFVLNEPDYDLLTGQDGDIGDNIPEVESYHACVNLKEQQSTDESIGGFSFPQSNTDNRADVEHFGGPVDEDSR